MVKEVNYGVSSALANLLRHAYGSLRQGFAAGHNRMLYSRDNSQYLGVVYTLKLRGVVYTLKLRGVETRKNISPAIVPEQEVQITG